MRLTLSALVVAAGLVGLGTAAQAAPAAGQIGAAPTGMVQVQDRMERRMMRRHRVMRHRMHRMERRMVRHRMHRMERRMRRNGM